MFRKIAEVRNDTDADTWELKGGSGYTEQLNILLRAIEQNPASIMITDRNGHLEYVNPQFTELTGYSLEDVKGKTPRILKSGHNSDELYRQLWDAVLAGKTWQGELCNKKKNGEFYWESASISPIVNDEGEITHILGIKKDITAQKAAEAKFRAVVENAYDGVILTDASGRFTYISPSVERILGYSPSFLEGKYPHDFLSSEDLPKIQSVLEDLLQNPGKTVVVDLRFRHKDGSWHWLENTVTNLLGDSNIRALVVNYHDITERRNAQSSLAAETLRRKMLFDQSPDGIVIIDPRTGRFIEFNTAAHKQLRYSAEEFSRLSIADIEAKETPEDTRETIAAVIRSGRADFDTVQRTKDGELRNVHVTAQYLDILGAPVYHCIWRDITDSKLAEEALRKSEEKFFKVFRANPEGVLITSAYDGTYIDVNEAFLAKTGFTREEVIGRTSVEMGIWIDPSERKWFAEQVSPDKLLKNVELQFRMKNGEIRDFLVSNEVLEISGQKCSLSFTVDVTDRKRVERELTKAKEDAEAEVRAKSQFLAVMSHEIRTPMNGILAVGELLQMTQLTHQQEEFVNTIRSSGELLLSVVNDVLDFSKLEYGNLDLLERPFGLRECVQEVCELLKSQALKKGIEFILKIDERIPATIISDKQRLMQVLFNIGGNAVKFTDEGRVTLSLQAKDDREDECRLVFTVKDTGMGFPREEIQNLFKPFTRIDSSASRAHGGTGLGLTISKRIAEQMGGGISGASQEGKGSTFIFTIPVKKSKHKPAEANKVAANEIGKMKDRGEARARLNILVAEDNATNQFVMDHALKIIGCRHDLVADGAEAIEAVRKGEYDVVFMDLHMPRMDGYQAAAGIIEMKKEQSPPVIVAVTADVPESVKQRCMQAGMSHFLAKPVTLSDLKSVLDRIAKDIPSVGSPPLPPDKTKIPEIMERLEILGFLGDPALALEFLETVRKDIVSLMDNVISAYEFGDVRRMRLDIHSLKGAATNVGANHLANLCKGLGILDDDAYPSAFSSRRAEFEKLCKETLGALEEAKGACSNSGGAESKEGDNASAYC